MESSGFTAQYLLHVLAPPCANLVWDERRRMLWQMELAVVGVPGVLAVGILSSAFEVGGMVG